LCAHQIVMLLPVSVLFCCNQYGIPQPPLTGLDAGKQERQQEAALLDAVQSEPEVR